MDGLNILQNLRMHPWSIFLHQLVRRITGNAVLILNSITLLDLKLPEYSKQAAVIRFLDCRIRQLFRAKLKSKSALSKIFAVFAVPRCCSRCIRAVYPVQSDGCSVKESSLSYLF